MTDSSRPDRRAGDRLLEFALPKVDAFEHCAHGIAVGEPGRNRIIACNRAFASLLGRPAGEIAGNPILSVYVPEDHERVKACIAEADRTGEVRYESRLVRADGSSVPVQMDVVSVRDETGAVSYRIAAAQDISERKRLEALLRESEQKYTILFERSATPTVLLKLPEAVIADANEACEQLLGFSREEMAGRTSVEMGIIGREERQRALDRLRSGGQLLGSECRITVRDGTERIVHFYTCQVTIGGQQFALTTMQDVTERKRAEESQRLSEERLRFALEASGLGSWSLDLKDNSATRTPIHARIFGYDTVDDDWSLQRFLGHVVPEDRDRVTQIVRDSAADRRAWDFECRIRRVDGELRWIHVRGGFERDAAPEHPGTVYGTVQDITERMLAAQSLEDSRLFLQKLADNVPAAVAYWLPDLTCLFANGRTLEWYGWTREQMKGIRVREFLGEDAYQASKKYLEGALRGEPQRFERTLKDKNGEVIDAWVQYIPDVGEHGVQGFFVLVSDITEVKRAQRAEGELATQLQQAQKMEVIGRLAGGVAHDFNNKLMVILGFAELARVAKDSRPELLGGYLDQIALAAQHSRDITMQLLAFSRQQVVSPRIIDANEVIAASLRSLGRLIGEDVDCRFTPAAGLWPILMDPAQLDQIIMNLAVNARDAMPDGGAFSILTDNVPAGALTSATLDELPPGDYVRLSFCDTGSGIDESVLPHVFEPFFTTKESGKGTGLGLATIYGIVMQNKGGIQVSSAPGSGARFDVYLPRREREAEPSPPPAVGPIRGSGTILLVEDEAAVRNVTALYLRELGYRIIEASTPGEALVVAADRTVTLDLLFTDVALPVMSGVRLAREIRALRPGLRVIYATGHTAEHQDLADLKAGEGVLQKPYDLRKLSDALKRQFPER